MVELFGKREHDCRKWSYHAVDLCVVGWNDFDLLMDLIRFYLDILVKFEKLMTV